MERGTFREDLYYRLNVVEVAIPPLRERREDIPRLLELFVDKYGKRYGRTMAEVPSEIVERFLDLRLPGQHPRAREPGAAAHRAARSALRAVGAQGSRHRRRRRRRRRSRSPRCRSPAAMRRSRRRCRSDRPPTPTVPTPPRLLVRVRVAVQHAEPAAAAGDSAAAPGRWLSRRASDRRRGRRAGRSGRSGSATTTGSTLKDLGRKAAHAAEREAIIIMLGPHRRQQARGGRAAGDQLQGDPLQDPRIRNRPPAGGEESCADGGGGGRRRRRRCRWSSVATVVAPPIETWTGTRSRMRIRRGLRLTSPSATIAATLASTPYPSRTRSAAVPTRDPLPARAAAIVASRAAVQRIDASGVRSGRGTGRRSGCGSGSGAGARWASAGRGSALGIERLERQRRRPIRHERGISIGSTSATVTAVVVEAVVAIAAGSTSLRNASAASCAVGAARINTTPMRHRPIAAAAGSAAGSTNRAPRRQPQRGTTEQRDAQDDRFPHRVDDLRCTHHSKRRATPGARVPPTARE